MSSSASLTQWLHRLQQGTLTCAFADTLAMINAHYEFTPTAFTNGAQRNQAGQNNGACQCLYFAQLHALTPQHTLLLFAEHYQSVLDTPNGQDHQNIRQFMQQGWSGVQFEGVALNRRKVE